MTDIFLAGAENQQHLALLTSCTATRVAVNVGSLLRRAAFSTWSLDLPYPDWEWIAYTDSPVAENDLELALDKASKPPLYVVGSELWENHDLYLPLYTGVGEVRADTTKGLYVTDAVFQSQGALRSILALRRPGMNLGVITGSIDRGIGRFDQVISSAWFSAMTYGETQVWDGQKMHRHNAKKKVEARQKHFTHIKNLGLDPDLVAADDSDECARLAITSWVAYGESLAGPVGVATTAPGQGLAVPGSGPSGVAIPTPVVRQQAVLPIMDTDSVWVSNTDAQGTITSEEVPLLRSQRAMIRSCNNCHLATAGCPGYVAGATCAYELPVQIRNREQLQATLEAVVEIQVQRILQARFSEEIQGQELSPATGREIERLYKITEKMTDILDDRESFKMTVKAKAQSGVISRLFGPSAGNDARQLPTPIDTNDVVDAIEVP